MCFARCRIAHGMEQFTGQYSGLADLWISGASSLMGCDCCRSIMTFGNYDRKGCLNRDKCPWYGGVKITPVCFCAADLRMKILRKSGGCYIAGQAAGQSERSIVPSKFALECWSLIGPPWSTTFKASFEANNLDKRFLRSTLHSRNFLSNPHNSPQASNHVWTRQGKDSQEVGVQEHQGRPSVPCGSYCPLPQEGQGGISAILVSLF